jgi:hypothetical protein
VRQPPDRRNSPPAPYTHAHATDAAEVNGRRCHHYSQSIPPTLAAVAAASGAFLDGLGEAFRAAGPLQPPTPSHCVVAETIGRLTFYAGDYYCVLSGIRSSTDLVSGRKKLAHNLRRPRSGIFIDIENDERRFS